MHKIFFPLLLLMCLSFPYFSFAQGNASGIDILQDFKNGNTQAITQLSQQAGIPTGSAQSILSGLKNNEQINALSGGKLLDGIISKKIPTGEIQNVVGMVNNLKNITADPKIIKDLVGKVAIGKLPPKIGETLSQLSDLGALADLKSIEDVFKLPDIANGLKDILSDTGLPSAVTDAISTITGMVGDVEALKEMGLTREQALNDTKV